MSRLSPAAIEAVENQAFGLMGRLHVILRREIGRVTDIKYMSSNAEYCRKVLDLAMQVANPDLQAISKKLESIYFGEHGLFEATHTKVSIIKTPKVAPEAPAKISMPIETHTSVEELVTSESEDVSNTYVGRLR